MKIKATFIIPVLNEERYIAQCLNSVIRQKFPLTEYEVLIIDGGSTDKTIPIVKRFIKHAPVRILKNPAGDAESGKRIGIQESRGKYIILLDADNEIVGDNWLSLGVDVLDAHPEVWGVESPWLLNKKDPLLNQYFSMLTITDPVARLFSPLVFEKTVVDYSEYETITVKNNATPVIGANGFFYRKKLISKEISRSNKFEEVNYVAYLVKQGLQTYARLKYAGIYHYYCLSLGKYAQKRAKIAKKFLVRKHHQQETWVDRVGMPKFLFSVVYNATFIGPLLEALWQIIRTSNVAWLYHPVVSWITVVIYARYFLQAKLQRQQP